MAWVQEVNPYVEGSVITNRDGTLETQELTAGMAADATWPVFVSLTILLVGLSAGFQLRRILFGKQVKTLDAYVLKVYTPGDVKAFFDELGEDHRKIYAWTQVTLDIAYPLVYGTLLALLIVSLHRPEWARWLVLVPCLGAGADVLDNGTAAVLAWRYTGSESALSWVATVFYVYQVGDGVGFAGHCRRGCRTLSCV